MKGSLFIGLMILCLCAVPGFSSAQQSAKDTPPASPAKSESTVKVEMKSGSQVVEEVSSLEHEMMGGIDWENKIVYAVGDGAPPKGAENPAQARARAKRAAIDEAYARLLETVNEVKVDAQSTTRNFINENRTVQTKVEGLIKNAEVVEQAQASDGSYQVKMKMPMTGAKGLSAAILPVELSTVRRVQTVSYSKQEGLGGSASVTTQTTQQATVTKAPDKPEEPKKTPDPPVTDPKPPAAGEKYTSLIVDAKGVDVKPALYPVIRTESGEVVYSLEFADPNSTIEDGLCTYRKSMEDCRKMPKVGDVPLVVKALKTGGKYGVDIVVSDQDGKKIVEANKVNPFLKWANVNVVID